MSYTYGTHDATAASVDDDSPTRISASNGILRDEESCDAVSTIRFPVAALSSIVLAVVSSLSWKLYEAHVQIRRRRAPFPPSSSPHESRRHTVRVESARHRRHRRHASPSRYDTMMRLIPTLAAVVAKAFMAGCVEVRVEGLAAFVALLQDQERRRGILTFSNHLSSMDEPLMWSAIPMRAFLDGNVRWTMGASDILFLSPIHNWFFKQGQVIETVRGGGIRQPAIAQAASKLDGGKWVHLFPEGKILCEHDHDLHKFKWGVGQILLEAREVPYVVPMHISGFDTLSPASLIPGYLPPSRISIKFGAPINALVDPLLVTTRSAKSLDAVRSEITDRLRQSVLALGQRQLEKRFRFGSV